MASKPNLQTLLEEILDSKNVYFQPPESVNMKYPAIVYGLKDIENEHADDIPYIQSYSYEITVIDYAPDSEIVKKIAKLNLCKFNRHFKSDNLNHFVFTLFY